MYDWRQQSNFPFSVVIPGFPGGSGSSPQGGFFPGSPPPQQGFFPPPPPNQGPGSFPPPPPPGPPSGGWNQDGPPTSPPPSFVPQLNQGPSLKAVDPGAIAGCRYKYTYVWLNSGQSFWFYPTYVGRRSVSGYRWTGFNWVYFGIDTNRISSFQCY